MFVIDGCNLLGDIGEDIHTERSQQNLIREISRYRTFTLEKKGKMERFILFFDSPRKKGEIFMGVEVRWTLNADRDIVTFIERIKDKSGIKVVTNDRGIIQTLKPHRALRFISCRDFIQLMHKNPLNPLGSES